MSFLNFGKDKASSEHLDTSNIKQAAISDTQLNSISSLNSTSELPSLDASPVNNNNLNSSSQENFINPFSKSSVPSSDSIPQSNFEQNNLNQNTSQMASNPFENTQNQTPVQPTTNLEQQSQAKVESENKQNLNQLNQNLTQSLQSQESMSKSQIKELIDETVEKVIEEKWDSLTQKIDSVLKWKEKKDEELRQLKVDIANIGEGFSNLENKLLSKITNYDRNILDVNSEIKALEKVFQKITPTLINNVNELEKITNDLKGVKQKKDEKESQLDKN